MNLTSVYNKSHLDHVCTTLCYHTPYNVLIIIPTTKNTAVNSLHWIQFKSNTPSSRPEPQGNGPDMPLGYLCRKQSLMHPIFHAHIHAHAPGHMLSSTTSLLNLNMNPLALAGQCMRFNTLQMKTHADT